MLDWLSSGLLWLGGIIILIGSIGMLRFPDFYTRVHAATLISVGGFTLALLGIAVQNFFGVFFIKIFIVLAVNFLTNPTATHALADSAYRLGVKPAKLVRDDMKIFKGGRG